MDQLNAYLEREEARYGLRPFDRHELQELGADERERLLLGNARVAKEGLNETFEYVSLSFLT